MTIAIDPVDLASRLIACPSVTPREAGTLTVLAEALQAQGFEIHRFITGEAPDGPVENMFATRGSGGPHFAFAGHVDVVPPGQGWTGDPFKPEIRGDLLYGRGAVDMKGGIAAFVAAAAETQGHSGTLSLIITGDEEGPATYGTPAIMDWMEERAIKPDMILIGEPTSEARLGDIVKIGRRGTVNMWIRVPGLQGHVAYPHRADNPVPALARIVAALDAVHLDDGTDAFQPSNLEFTAIGSASGRSAPRRQRSSASRFPASQARSAGSAARVDAAEGARVGAAEPYHLYAASNLGSMLALLAYLGFPQLRWATWVVVAFIGSASVELAQGLGGTLVDGTDTLQNIERLQFADQTIYEMRLAEAEARAAAQ